MQSIVKIVFHLLMIALHIFENRFDIMIIILFYIVNYLYFIYILIVMLVSTYTINNITPCTYLINV